MNVISRLFMWSGLLVICMVVSLSCSTQKSTVESGNSFDLEDHSIIFRRTTLIVHDIDASLSLYRDAMGMDIIYDNVIKRPHPNGNGEQHIRLVFLKATHDHVGVVGLIDYEYSSVNKVKKTPRKEGFEPQNAVMLFNTNDLRKNFEKIKRVNDVEIIKEPGIRTYPSYDGKGIIKVLVSIFYDPDGFLIEYNQVLEGL